MALTNRFGWSISREALFESCRRRYFFHYYLSWGGWGFSAPERSREAFKLKRLISLPLWRGQLVHYVTTKVLASIRKKGSIPDPADVERYTEERFRRQYEFSRSRQYLKTPKKRGDRLNIDWLALFDHEYGLEIDKARIDMTLGECLLAMRNLLKSPILSIILDTRTEDWVIENIDIAEFAQVFDFGGAQVFAKTDFIFRGNDGTYNIVDWKTYRGEEAENGESGEGRAGVQLGVYGYYAARVLGEPVDTIRLHEVNLLKEGRAVVHVIGEDTIEESRTRIAEGIDRLSSCLVHRDMARNEPLEEESFPLSESPSCRFCNFFRICVGAGAPGAKKLL